MAVKRKTIVKRPGIRRDIRYYSRENCGRHVQSRGDRGGIRGYIVCASENFIQRFQPNVTMLRPYRLVSTVSVSSPRKSVISKEFAPDNIFGRDSSNAAGLRRSAGRAGRSRSRAIGPMESRVLSTSKSQCSLLDFGFGRRHTLIN